MPSFIIVHHTSAKTENFLQRAVESCEILFLLLLSGVDKICA
jgi:hypothetical protein